MILDTTELLREAGEVGGGEGEGEGGIRRETLYIHDIWDAQNQLLVTNKLPFFFLYYIGFFQIQTIPSGNHKHKSE